MTPQKIDNNPNKPFKSYAQYSGLAFQMGSIIGLSVWGGISLDEYLHLSFPAFTVTFALLSVIISMIWLIRSISSK